MASRATCSALSMSRSTLASCGVLSGGAGAVLSVAAGSAFSSARLGRATAAGVLAAAWGDAGAPLGEFAGQAVQEADELFGVDDPRFER